MKTSKLCLLDNSFPDQLSAFRYAEFKAYLEAIPEATAVCLPQPIVDSMASTPVEHMIRRFERENPHLQGRAIPYAAQDAQVDRDSLLYFVFLSNARIFKSELEKGNPFIFTLYPGGGFFPYSAESNKSLREIFSYKGFRHVIVTQPFIREYLIRGAFCSPGQITLIPGVVVPSEFLASSVQRLQKPKDEPLNICFVAYRYGEGGREKGFDIFCDVVRRLISTTEHELRFHLVGGWEQDVFDDELRRVLNFHDAMETNKLLKFLAQMDILISPNRSGEPKQGRFDGFPTGAAVQAGLAGAAVFASDCLWQNRDFRDGEEIVIINNSASEIGDRVASYIDNRQRLTALRSAGMRAFRRLYSYEAQMAPRIELLQGMLQQGAL